MAEKPLLKSHESMSAMVKPFYAIINELRVVNVVMFGSSSSHEGMDNHETALGKHAGR